MRDGTHAELLPHLGKKLRTDHQEQVGHGLVGKDPFQKRRKPFASKLQFPDFIKDNPVGLVAHVLLQACLGPAESSR